MIRAAVAFVLLAVPAAAQTATDGDTIRLNGTTWRLWGIDAPELRQAAPTAGRLATRRGACSRG